MKEQLGHSPTIYIILEPDQVFLSQVSKIKAS